MSARLAWGVGLATVTDSGKTLDVWYPHPRLGAEDSEAAAAEVARLTPLERRDEAREVHVAVVKTQIDFDEPIGTVADAYLRLHCLSARLVTPNSICLDGLFENLSLVAWTNAGPCDYEGFEETRLRLRAKLGDGLNLRSIDRIPRMADYVTPPDVRIANTENVRLGAYLSPGTTVAHAGFINYNAGTLGRCTVEGRLSQGVVIDDGTDIAGGASTAGTLTPGAHPRVSLGKNCLLGSNAGLAIPLGDNCVVESGLYLTTTTRIYYMPSGGVMPGEYGFFTEPRIMSAVDLAGVSNALFRRNSETGRVEAVSRGGQEIEFAD